MYMYLHMNIHIRDILQLKYMKIITNKIILNNIIIKIK